MNTIKYEVTFHTDWHCGSGLAAGADVDALVVKDKDDMPFIPGKTIKGLVREAVEELLFLKKEFENKSNAIWQAFGNSEDRNTKKETDCSKNYELMEKGCMFFTNATLDNKEQKAIVSNHAAKFMYRDIANTAIGNDGIAKEHSLRKIQVVVPCTLYGVIMDVPDEMVDEIIESLQFIKRLGQNRNRGLGRCTIKGRKEDNNENA